MLKFITALLFAQVLLAAPMPQVTTDQEWAAIHAHERAFKKKNHVENMEDYICHADNPNCDSYSPI